MLRVFKKHWLRILIAISAIFNFFGWSLLPKSWRETMNFFSPADLWLVNHTPSITLTIILMSLFVGVGLIPDSWRIFKYFRNYSPFSITFDVTNPSNRFWSLENTPDPNDIAKFLPPHWVYRIEIKNKTSKTLKNVRVTTENLGNFPRGIIFHSYDKYPNISFDIHPGTPLLIPILPWWNPRIQPGTLAGPSAWGYGPIRIIVSGEDVMPCIKTYAVNPEYEQMLFEIKESSRDNVMNIG